MNYLNVILYISLLEIQVNEWKRSDYVDRAEQRRTRVGSEPIQAKHISGV